MDFDVVVVGAGIAGLATAIRLKQLAPALTVVVIEKGAEVGAHILSGAVVDPVGIDALLPGWRDEADHPFQTPVTHDRYLVLTQRRAFVLPDWLTRLAPPALANAGNFVVSLGAVARWLAQKAEALGVDIFPGFAGAELLFGANGAVTGVATGDMGIGRDSRPTSGYAPGMELRARYTILAEGARGSLAKQAVARYGLASQHPKFGLGLKEVWEIPANQHSPGLVQHTFGWPLDNRTGGGSFLYHLADNQVTVGLVVHLDYANPYLSPFEEFQRFKTHPAIRGTLQGGKRIAYGARAITEGGWQSVPRLAFPGGALVGCAAGLVNVPRIKGSHNAVLSGMACAEALAVAIAAGRSHDELAAYEQGWRTGPVGQDLRPVRNVKPLWSRFGTLLGVPLAALDIWINTLTRGWSPFGTLSHRKADHATLKPAAGQCAPAYPRPDGIVSFDRMSSVYLSGTNHAEDQPIHLHVRDQALQRSSEHGVYAGPSTRYCPAGVYEWLEAPEGAYLQINAQNCVHCKACDIKDPNQNIDWRPPQGAEGPAYGNM